MNFIAFEKYSLKTDLSRDEAIKRLDKFIEPRQLIRIRALKSKRNKPYEGNIDGHNFKIMRVIGYGNSFVPTITGEIKGELRGSRIEVKMRPKKIVIAIFGFIFSLFTMLFFLDWNLIIYIAGLLFMYMLAIFGFNIVKPTDLFP